MTNHRAAWGAILLLLSELFSLPQESHATNKKIRQRSGHLGDNLSAQPGQHGRLGLNLDLRAPFRTYSVIRSDKHLHTT